MFQFRDLSPCGISYQKSFDSLKDVEQVIIMDDNRFRFQENVFVQEASIPSGTNNQVIGQHLRKDLDLWISFMFLCR